MTSRISATIQAAFLARAPQDIVIDTGTESITAAQLLAVTAELQDQLKSAGVCRLALLAANSPAWIVADIAAQNADICLLPLPTFFSDEQLSHSLNAVGVDAILTDNPARIINLLPSHSVLATSPSITSLMLVMVKNAAHIELPLDAAKITFTSGSSGQPRGVCLSLEQQLNVARGLYSALHIDAPRHLCLLPLSTLLENIGGVYYPLLAHGSVIVPSETDTGFSGSANLDIDKMLRMFDRHRPISSILLPQMLIGLVAALQAGWQPPAELRFVAVGGGKVAPDLLRKARAFGFPVYEGYGLSEAGSVVCLNVPDATRIGSVGKPLPHVTVSVNDGEVGVSGNTFLGYLDDPASWGSSTVATGDIGKLDPDGYLHLAGRRKNLLISSFGRNISPEWVESEMLRASEIRQCVVFGDGRPYCTALLTAESHMVTDAMLQQAISLINAGLPDYARVERWCRLEEPLTVADGLFTDNGRPKRKAIFRRYKNILSQLYTPLPIERTAS